MLYEIHSGKVSAKIDSKGAEVRSLKKDGKEYIWQRDPKFWEDCAPILFPVVGELRGGVLSIAGKDYPMPAHGFVQASKMQVLEKTDDAVTFCLNSDAETKKLYPWDFRFTVRFLIKDNTLYTKLLVENTGSKEMLFGLGGHPGFRVPMEEGASFEDYQLEFEIEERLDSNMINLEICEICAEKKKTILDGGNILPLRRELFETDTMIFEDIGSRFVDLVHKDSKKGVRFSYGNFPVLAVWSCYPEESPFVCLEPWHSMGFRDNEDTNIENKYGILHLAAGQTFEDEFSIEILG